ncbi:MAG: hypothetical protein QOC73_300 [Actinomycetota bacterium]|nr:hypothetical protein [Actinomycetota bacterium]
MIEGELVEGLGADVAFGTATFLAAGAEWVVVAALVVPVPGAVAPAHLVAVGAPPARTVTRSPGHQVDDRGIARAVARRPTQFLCVAVARPHPPERAPRAWSANDQTERSTDRIDDLPSSADRKADSRAIVGTLAARPVRSGRSIRDVPCQGQAYGVVDECLGECG